MSDKGFGKFGSLEWHKSSINVLPDSASICWYLMDLAEIVIKPCSTLEQTRQKAILAIEGEM